MRLAARLLLVGALALGACGETPEQARAGIAKRGYPVTLEGFLKALDADDMPVKLRFLILDSDNRLRHEAMLVRAACNDRPAEREGECLGQIDWLIGRGADPAWKNEAQQTAMILAAENARLDVVTYLIGKHVPVGAYAVVEEAIDRAAAEYYPPRRKKLEEISRALQIAKSDDDRFGRGDSRKAHTEQFRLK